jgi:hypothetical protein
VFASTNALDAINLQYTLFNVLCYPVCSFRYYLRGSSVSAESTCAYWKLPSTRTLFYSGSCLARASVTLQRLVRRTYFSQSTFLSPLRVFSLEHLRKDLALNGAITFLEACYSSYSIGRLVTAHACLNIHSSSEFC